MPGWQILSLRGGDGADAFDQSMYASPTLILLPVGNEDLAGRIAAQTGGNLLGRLKKIALDDAALVATRAAYGGRVEITTRYASGICIALMHSLDDVDLPDAKTLSLPPAPALSVKQVELGVQTVALEGARIVVSGGRGLDEAGFTCLGVIAEKLGGALGGSLPAVDAGLVSVSRQIGQSGKFVTPEIYLAVGMSGTPQHMAGIGMATRIFAINKDADAAIFEFAEAGAIADAGELLPLLAEALDAQA